MKPLLLHGPAINASRKKLTEIRQKFNSNNIVIFEKGSSVSDILAYLQTVSMFTEERLIIVENPGENFVFGPDINLVLWFDKEIDTKKWPDAQVLFFLEEKEASIFPLLDQLGNRDIKAYLELEKRNQTSPNDTQYILTMVYYLLRSLVVTPKAAHDFVKQKNARMRKNFSEQELINLYKFILDLDFKIKFGLIETSHAEFLLVNEFIS